MLSTSPASYAKPWRSKYSRTAVPAGPQYTRFPDRVAGSRARRTIWSNRLKILPDGWWMVTITERPSSARSRIRCMTSVLIAESRPDVGSSKNMIRGLLRRPMPIETRFFSPPEMPRTKNPPILVSCALASPSWSMTSCTRAAFCARENSGPIFRRAVYMSISKIEKVPQSVSNCSTYPVSRERSAGDGTWPSKSTRPSTAPCVLRPLMTSISVDFPAPEDPISATIVPASSVPVTPGAASPTAPSRYTGARGAHGRRGSSGPGTR